MKTNLMDVDVSLAVCAQTAPDMYFPEGKAGDITREVLNAKAMCFQCPIVSPCFESAMATVMIDDWGVWGGTTRHERANMRRKPASLKEHRRKVQEAEYANQIEGEAA